jgi:AhpD family alkylhydroperoxidase
MTTEPFPSASPRLKPIERPNSWWMRLVYWITRWTLGRVITPVKVVYARVSGSATVAQKMNATESKLSLDPELRFLIKSYVATLNGCSFCADIAHAHAQDQGVPTDKYENLLRYETSDVFSPRERAALAYVGEATRNKAVSDATFDTLQMHFDDRAIAEMTWLNAMENYYNLMNRPLNIASDNLCAVSPTTDTIPARHAA